MICCLVFIFSEKYSPNQQLIPLISSIIVVDVVVFVIEITLGS